MNMQKFKPKSRVFSEWMDYAHLLTVCYNYDKEVQKFTILRTRILFQAPANNSVSGLYIAYETYVSMIHVYYYLKYCSIICYLYNRTHFSTPLESWQRSHVSVNC